VAGNCKWPQPFFFLRYCPGVCMEDLGNHRNLLIRISGAVAEILIKYLPDVS
jgi:hypothetical protein